MFQEMHDRSGRHAAVRAAQDIAARAGPPLVAQGDAPCAMMTDVRMERGRTESIVGREAELEALLRAATGADRPGWCCSPATPESARPGC